MEPTVLKITAAGLMHDIGKFADKTTLNVSEKYMNNHADLYQPYNRKQRRHTHPHAVYTAAFIEKLGDRLPRELNSPVWGDGDPFINLAAGHHRPETPMQWIIAIADRISSGWDRDTFDSEYNLQVPWKDYKRTRLLSLFEGIRIDDSDAAENRIDLKYCFPLRPLSVTSMFPVLQSECVPPDSHTGEREYQEPFNEFVEGLGSLHHRSENLELWLDHFDSLLMVYTSTIPAARAGDVVPDVSLYDHSKSTAALAAALYQYHRATNTLTVQAVKDYRDEKFMIVNGDFYGIQDFIFTGHGDVRRYRSKLLRGRSFAISLISELAADMLCRRIGMPSLSVVLNAAGKFTVVAPNTAEAQNAVEVVETNINDWLIGIFYGENSLGFSIVKASPDDFVAGRFPNLWDRIVVSMERKKTSRIDLDKYGGAVAGHLDNFDNSLQHPLCPLCGKRPSSKEVKSTRYVEEVKSACKVCRDHIFLGTNIVKKDRLAITSLKADIKDPDNKLMEPILAEYQVAFPDGTLNQMAQKGELLRHWDLGVDPEGRVPVGVTAKFLRGYVPVHSEADWREERYFEGDKSDAKKEELVDQIKPGEPKTLNHLALMSLNEAGDSSGFCGTEALGVLKADVDDLGFLMACGLPPKRLTISRMATLSRQLNLYFAAYLPYRLRTEFGSIYTVFAGGDDLFLIGPWNQTVALAGRLRESFVRYVCQNKAIHLSAGISVHKPHTPIDRLAQAAEEALERSKGTGKNRFTVFNETTTWEELNRLLEIKETLEHWLNQDLINNAMLYRLNTFIDMAAQEKRIVRAAAVHMDDMECTKWRAFLAYTTERNVAKEIKGEERQEAVRKVASSLAEWLTKFGGKLRIPLWHILYDMR